MGFVGSMFGKSNGSGFQAQSSGNNTQLKPLYDQGQQVSNMYLNEAQGNGPSVADAQLQQATNQNVAQNAGFISSQKGINPALAARLAAQNQAQMQQQAAGQSSVTRAQEQLAAQQGLANLNQSQQGIIQGGMNAENTGNLGIAQTNAKGQQQMFGGALQGAAMAAMAHGGEVPMMADGGMSQAQPLTNPLIPAQEPEISAGAKFMKAFADQTESQSDPMNDAGQAVGKGIGQGLSSLFGSGSMGSAAPMGGAGAADLGAGAAMMAAQGGMAPTVMKAGGTVPGKAKVEGDNLQNDTVDAKLSPREIVIPRSITMGENAPQRAAEFVAKVLAQHNQKKNNFAVGGMSEPDAQPSAPVLDPSQQGLLNNDPSMLQGAIESLKNRPLDEYSQAIKDRDEEVKAQELMAAGAGKPVASNGVMPEGAMPQANSEVSVAQPKTEATNDYISRLGKDFAQQEQGVMQEASAQGKVANAQKGIEENLAKNLGANQSEFKNQIQDANEARKQTFDAVQQYKVDPNHYLANMSTEKKVRTAIGLILGGLGSGLTGQANAAQTFLQNAIDADVKSQQLELGKKENLLANNMQQFKNIHDATTMTRVNLMDQAEALMKTEALKQGDPIARARGLKEAAEIKAKADQLIGPMQMKQSLLKQAKANGADPARLVPLLVPQEHQKEVFAEIEAAENAKHFEKNIMDSFEQAVKENTVLKTGAGLLRTPGSVYALHQHMQPTFKDLEGTVRQAAMDNTFKNITPAGGDSEHTTGQRRNALKEYLKAKQSAPTARAYGIDLNDFRSTTTDPMKGLPAQEQLAVQQAKARILKNPNDVAAKAYLDKRGIQ